MNTNLINLSKALHYLCDVTAVPPAAQKAARQRVMDSGHQIPHEVALARFNKLMQVTQEDMPPDTDDLVVMLETVAFRFNLLSRAAAWEKCGIVPGRGRDLLARNRNAVDWPLWFTIRTYAFGNVKPPRNR